MENETIESVVDKVEGQLQDKITESKTKKKRIDVNEVIKAINEGISLKELANRFNVSYCAFYNYKELKEALQNRKIARKNAILQQIEELVAQGLNNNEIASRIGISVVTLRKFMGKKPKRKKNKVEVIEVSEKEIEALAEKLPDIAKNNEISPEMDSRSMIPAPAKPELEGDTDGTNKQS